MVREWLPEKYQFSDKILQGLIEIAEAEPQKKQEDAAKRTEQLPLLLTYNFNQTSRLA
jgi:hypothetical protein